MAILTFSRRKREIYLLLVHTFNFLTSNCTVLPCRADCGLSWPSYSEGVREQRLAPSSHQLKLKHICMVINLMSYYVKNYFFSISEFKELLPSKKYFFRRKNLKMVLLVSFAQGPLSGSESPIRV